MKGTQRKLEGIERKHEWTTAITTKKILCDLAVRASEKLKRHLEVHLSVQGEPEPTARSTIAAQC